MPPNLLMIEGSSLQEMGAKLTYVTQKSDTLGDMHKISTRQIKCVSRKMVRIF